MTVDEIPRCVHLERIFLESIMTVQYNKAVRDTPG